MGARIESRPMRMDDADAYLLKADLDILMNSIIYCCNLNNVYLSDEEVTDPKALLEERSKAKCVSQWYDYQKCVKRIADDETGQKHCTGQYFDYWQCVDKNVAEKLFQMLK
ncbi:hypothetical protein PR202_ga01632 [Eleusine coracana subsp. coracana]|uniref:Complex III subunit VI n=1 Tax=Eleusine coracana subsp. coracana TaxID=191504 RepID=A0AAV5BHN2_ELECO|nr:hypothetical protein PR202_ga00945 [Eleusine coracana subsp. coracana]GJM85830.1 hypothetical protein PR202_ga01632 [Eleusine coracana subsp. coracana]